MKICRANKFIAMVPSQTQTPHNSLYSLALLIVARSRVGGMLIYLVQILNETTSYRSARPATWALAVSATLSKTRLLYRGQPLKTL